jgi:hypothetical protein
MRKKNTHTVQAEVQPLFYPPSFSQAVIISEWHTIFQIDYSYDGTIHYGAVVSGRLLNSASEGIMDPDYSSVRYI